VPTEGGGPTSNNLLDVQQLITNRRRVKSTSTPWQITAPFSSNHVTISIVEIVADGSGEAKGLGPDLAGAPVTLIYNGERSTYRQQVNLGARVGATSRQDFS
jgi:hypothetical protein